MARDASEWAVDGNDAYQVEVGRGRFNGEGYAPAWTREDADAACRALGWTLVEEVDAGCAVWLARLPAHDVERLECEDHGDLHVCRGGFYGVCEMP